MYYIVAITFLLYNLLFLMLTYSYYKMYKYITILEKRINCIDDNNSTRTIYIKEDKAEGTSTFGGVTIPLVDIGTNTEGTFGWTTMLKAPLPKTPLPKAPLVVVVDVGVNDTEGTFGGGGGGGGGGGDAKGTFGVCRGYKIMLITMINNCNDDDINTLIDLYIQIISMIKNIYTKFSELYMQKN